MNQQFKIEKRHQEAQGRVKSARRLEGIAWAATGCWMAGWFCILLLGYCVPSVPPLSDYGLNEIGDWVAGAVAAPVLIWLVISYKQQAAALELNSAELALSVQEVKEQASATRSLAGQHRREIEPAISGQATWTQAAEGHVEVAMTLKNAGRLAIRSSVFCDVGPESSREPRFEDLWPSGSTRSLDITLYEDEVEGLNDVHLKGRAILFCNEATNTPHAFVLFIVSTRDQALRDRTSRVGVIEMDAREAAASLIRDGWELGQRFTSMSD